MADSMTSAEILNGCPMITEGFEVRVKKRVMTLQDNGAGACQRTRVGAVDEENVGHSRFTVRSPRCGAQHRRGPGGGET